MEHFKSLEQIYKKAETDSTLYNETNYISIQTSLDKIKSKLNQNIIQEQTGIDSYINDDDE
ncbi:hypothetical protein LFWB_1180 [Candidatus Phytoplasma luffae]|uniref:Uncharacterized protein n=1 Tax=Loofah witches'-broom phytoplasma TaxID=35773 RepID=A0A975FHY8_LOWBP|nr:hypothetical protein [Candidatus Phytoplasma luffae]QTX02688.1 hypothetical protein LFWB_1180 [Candidatus Phytoplasma luffae]